MDDPVRAAIQAICDESDAGGWQVAHYVIAVGLERVDAEGQLDNALWVVPLKGQPEYISDGLLDAAQRFRIEIAED